MLLVPPPAILGIQAVKRKQVGELVVVGLVLDCCDSAAMLLLQVGLLILKKASEEEVGDRFQFQVVFAATESALSTLSRFVRLRLNGRSPDKSVHYCSN